MTADIVRVARAIFEELGPGGTFENLPKDRRDLKDNLARYGGDVNLVTQDDLYDAAIAAIKEMHTPSKECLEKVNLNFEISRPGEVGYPSPGYWDWLQGHRAMIKAALGEEP
jgi:hypothetical protein